LARSFVSVLIDTYNHERFIEQAIVSVLEQDFPAAEREIVVVDDGSTDRTPEIVKKFEPHVRLMRKENGGQASAFNAGIPECQGEIVAFLDGDDWWEPKKLCRVVETMDADSGIGMVGHAIVESFEDGKERIIALDKAERLRLNTVRSAEVFRLHRAYLGTSRLVLRTNIARQLLPVPEALIIEADEYLFTLAASMADFVILTEPLSHYRIHPGNLFLAAASNPGGLRRKQRVLAALVDALSRELPARGVPREVARCVVELVEVEATQLRLMLDGGFPWETFRTESAIYEIQHADASWKQRLYRRTTMIGALFLPPRWFYAARFWISNQSWYLRMRKEFLPVPGITRISPSRHANE
jgi:glycosyltransferase involved in cell wall biosynthesis